MAGRKMQERIVLLRLRVQTNLDDSDLERRLVDFVTPAALQDSLEGLGERIDLLETDCEIGEPVLSEASVFSAGQSAEALHEALHKGRVKTHEWAEHSNNLRTVCGLTLKLEARSIVRDLGTIVPRHRCASCERMRSAIGTSRSSGKVERS